MFPPKGGPGFGRGGPFGFDRGPGGGPPPKEPPGFKDGPPPDGKGGPKKDGPNPTESMSERTAVLEAVLDFYDKFAQQKVPDARVQLQAGKAARRVSEGYVLLNRSEKAVAAFNRAVALLGPLVEQNPSNDAARTELALTYLVAPPEAFPNDAERPLRLAADLARANPWLAATVRFRLGLVLEQARDWSGAETAYREAAVTFVAVEPAKRPNPGHLEPAFARLRLSAVLGEQGKFPQARKVLEESVAALRPVADQGGGGFRPEREWLGMTYWALVDVCQRLKDDRAANDARQNAQQYSGFGGPKKDGPGGPGKWDGKKDWEGKKDGPPPPKKGE
jgi:tetratricopeptide (TPR) repeat protein